MGQKQGPQGEQSNPIKPRHSQKLCSSVGDHLGSFGFWMEGALGLRLDTVGRLETALEQTMTEGFLTPRTPRGSSLCSTLLCAAQLA